MPGTLAEGSAHCRKVVLRGGFNDEPGRDGYCAAYTEGAVGKQIHAERELMYLGVRLNDRLAWNSHLAHTVPRAQTRLMILRRVVGSTWGISQQMMYRLYTRVVSPMMAIWFSGVVAKGSTKQCSKVLDEGTASCMPGNNEGHERDVKGIHEHSTFGHLC